MNRKLMMFLAVSMFSLGGFLPAQAQSDDEVEVANVPFDFYAGAQKMPAGTYSIGLDRETNVITLSEISGKHGKRLMGAAGSPGGEKPELVFDHSGNTYALREVKDDFVDLTLHTSVPEEEMGSRVLSHVEVALSR